MNIRSIVAVALLVGVGRMCVASDITYALPYAYRFPPRWQGDAIVVRAGAPPLLLLVTDAAGRRVGADWSGTFTGYGMGSEIQEIPDASIEQSNNYDDEQDPPTPAARTTWRVRLPDREPHVYLVSVKAIQSASTYVRVFSFLYPEPSSALSPTVLLPVLVDAGQVKHFQVTTSRDQQRLECKRVVHPGDLSRSVRLSCALKRDEEPESFQVDSPGVCQSLEAKARAIEAAMSRARTTAMKGAVKAFLNELAAQAGKHVHEPALTILREEAEALLNPPPPFKVKPKPKPAPKAASRPTR